MVIVQVDAKVVRLTTGRPRPALPPTLSPSQRAPPVVQWRRGCRHRARNVPSQTIVRCPEGHALPGVGLCSTLGRIHAPLRLDVVALGLVAGDEVEQVATEGCLRLLRHESVGFDVVGGTLVYFVVCSVHLGVVNVLADRLHSAESPQPDLDANILCLVACGGADDLVSHSRVYLLRVLITGEIIGVRGALHLARGRHVCTYLQSHIVGILPNFEIGMLPFRRVSADANVFCTDFEPLQDHSVYQWAKSGPWPWTVVHCEPSTSDRSFVTI